jgi:hypothetical protein
MRVRIVSVAVIVAVGVNGDGRLGRPHEIALYAAIAL